MPNSNPKVYELPVSLPPTDATGANKLKNTITMYHHLPPLSTTYDSCINICHEHNSTLSSLVESRLIVPTHAARLSRQLMLFCFACLPLKKSISPHVADIGVFLVKDVHVPYGNLFREVLVVHSGRLVSCGLCVVCFGGEVCARGVRRVWVLSGKFKDYQFQQQTIAKYSGGRV